MSAPVAMRNLYADLYGEDMLPVLEELFVSEYEQYPMVRDQVMKVVSSDRDIYQTSEIGDMGLFRKVSEGSEYSYEAPAALPGLTMTHEKYGLGFSISREMVADGRFDKIGMMTRKLARSGKESQEIAAMNVFNNGFSTQVTPDGLSLFNAAHTLDPVTFSNTASVAGDLSESTLQSALAQFDTMNLGDTGIIYRIAPRILLVHSNNKRNARELIGSELKPGGQLNNINSLRDDNLIVISSPHFTDVDAWFVLAAPEDTGLRIAQREALATSASKEVGFHTDSWFYKASYRESIGTAHAKGVFRNPGA